MSYRHGLPEEMMVALPDSNRGPSDYEAKGTIENLLISAKNYRMFRDRAFASWEKVVTV